MGSEIRRLVLDVLKPHDPKLAEFTRELSTLEAVAGVTAKLVDIDEDVRTLRVTIEGADLDLEVIEEQIADLSGSVHSVDEVSCGDRIVEDDWIANG